MASVNKVILIGNLGKDPEVKSLESGKKVASFSIATTEKYKDKEETTWHNVVLWEKLAEIAGTYLKKGSQVYIEGRISNRSYDDKDGVKKYISEIIGSSLTMLGSKPTGSGTSDAPASKAETSAKNYMDKTPATQETARTAAKEPEYVSDTYNSTNFGGDSDDLPF